MGLSLSNITNNPFVQSVNQSVVSNITSAATGAVNNLIGNVEGALGSAGSIASGLAHSLSSAGLPLGAAGDIMATQLDTLISGSSSYFSSGSPERITQNALLNRNLTSVEGSNPETKVPTNATTTTGGARYVYPSDPAPYFMTLDFAKYARPNPYGNTTLNSIGSVVLPLPDGSGFVDNTTANWQESSLGLIGNALDGIKDVGNLKDQDLGTLLKGAGAEGAMVAADTVGRALSEELVNAAESQLGLVPNPSLSLLFKGVGFRSFSFNWTFAPKTDAESNTIRDIIRFIKAKHLPTFTGSGGTGGTSFIFNYPAVVKPSFSLGQNYMTHYKYCVIKSVNVNYSPQGSAPAFYSSTKAPAFINLSIELEEMEYVLATDYDPTAKGTLAADIVAGQAKSAFKAIFP